MQADREAQEGRAILFGIFGVVLLLRAVASGKISLGVFDLVFVYVALAFVDAVLIGFLLATRGLLYRKDSIGTSIGTAANLSFAFGLWVPLAQLLIGFIAAVVLFLIALLFKDGDSQTAAMFLMWSGGVCGALIAVACPVLAALMASADYDRMRQASS